MRKLNTSLLTAAVVGALGLSGVASAASLVYDPAGSQQITFAKDLIVNNGTTIETPTGLTLTATAPDAGNVVTVAGGDTLTVKVTLTAGAQFDPAAPAATLVATFLEGDQTGGGDAPLTVVGTPYYSASGQELNFEYTATGGGTIGAAGDSWLTLNSFQVTNLVQGLATGSAIGAEITVQNASGQQILAQSATIARSVWGLVIEDDTTMGNTSKTIDVAADPRKTEFSPFGTVGGSVGAGVAATYFNAGYVNVDVAQALETDGTTESYINNFNATAATPEYNVVNTAVFTVTVSGDDLSSFEGGNAWLDKTSNCSTATAGASRVNAAAALSSAGDLVFSSPATSGFWNDVTSAPPSGAGSHFYVCLGASGDEINPQELSGSVAVNYNLPTQRVNPPALDFSLLPLRLNGTTLIFQNVNPGANVRAESFLRLTNNNAQICPISIDAKDDAGLHTSEITAVLAPHTSIHLNSNDMENGNAAKGLTGAWGDGTGRWYVRVTAECANLAGSALNRNHDTGVVTDLTPAKAETWLTPAGKL
ncbi:hypothetical protein FQY83_14755 [Luteimonas marina]|uniref:Uncharacterized protein n=1 Tax=Luteimonas marina TaxID=488485 RepID=A0A5C5TWR8_9GAMM|nr:hypothetical protein [Luteimonas marina]TWT18633.1 hypothetical protein FQY83_14755 [Luteimonas marina]